MSLIKTLGTIVGCVILFAMPFLVAALPLLGCHSFLLRVGAIGDIWAPAWQVMPYLSLSGLVSALVFIKLTELCWGVPSEKELRKRRAKLLHNCDCPFI